MTDSPVPVTIIPSGNKKQTTKKSVKDFDIISSFLGYRNKEDKTNLPVGYLVDGSKNVLNTTGGRIACRRGYTIYGQRNTTLAGIESSYDFLKYNGDEVHLRAGNGKLEFVYSASVGDKYLTNTFTQGQIFWLPIMSGLSSNKFNFCDWWDDTQKANKILFVNESAFIYEWSGGVTTFLSGTANTITKTGTQTWAELGFSTTGTVVINGNEYTYTGGTGTTTLTGTTNASAEPANSVTWEKPKATANSGITGIPATLKNFIIEVLGQQVYLAGEDIRAVYVSKLNNYKDFSFSAARKVGEGMILYPDANPIAFVPQEADMYIACGYDYWFQTEFTLSSDLVSESLKIKKLKTASGQAAQSQALISKIKNSVVFINNEPTLDELGRVEQILGTPQAINYSDPIKNLFDTYDFTNGQVFYFKYFIFVSVPQEGVVLIFNLAKGFWEAPQILPIGRFSVIAGELYGHDYNIPQSYKLLTGYNDDGHAIEAVALFSFQNFGLRGKTKDFNEYFVEGYIDTNTTLDYSIQYETEGCSSYVSFPLTGDDKQVVCLPTLTSSLGKESLGKNPLGGELNQHNINDLPPKFRLIQTLTRKPFYEVQFGFSSLGADYRWELLAFGPKVASTMFGENDIKK